MSGLQTRVRLPSYTPGEELFSSVSHGLGALASIPAAVLLLTRAHGALEVSCCSVFGFSMVFLYTMSCLYHALSPRCRGKRVLRVMDHCAVFALLLGTYVPVSLLGVGGTAGRALLAVVSAFASAGIVLTAVHLERFRTAGVLCELICGWSIVLGLGPLRETAGPGGLRLVLLGGLFYTVGSVLYGLGARKRYMHCVFHLFCLAGTVCHCLAIYGFLSSA